MYKPKSPVAAGILLLSFAGITVAQDEEAAAPVEEIANDDNMRECIQVRRIRRTEVLDDKTIVFRLQGSPIYINIMPGVCPGLKREDRFTYRTTISALCRQDSIAVLFNEPGGGMRTGPGCALGAFHLISRDDLKSLKEAMKEVPEANPLPMPEPGDVDAEDNEEDVPR
jgi:hypothetical protein